MCCCCRNRELNERRTESERARTERNSESERSERTSSQAPNVVRVVVVSDAVSAVVVAVAVVGRRR